MIFESISLIYCVREDSGFLQHVLSFSSGIIIQYAYFMFSEFKNKCSTPTADAQKFILIY